MFRDRRDVVYLATARVTDGEMKDRISLHRSRRPKEWETYEGNDNLKEAVGAAKNYLLDCITILTSNILFDLTGESGDLSPERQREVEDRVVGEVYGLIEAVEAAGGDLVMVTNEVGDSIVPEHPVARVYRDIAGRVNQRIAGRCGEVYLVVCGIPLRLKG